MLEFKLREAKLDDTFEIVSCNIDDVEKWRHFDQMKFLDEASWDELTPFERYMHGGPWLDPQTFRIHFETVKEANGDIIIAEYNDKVIGELDYVVDSDDESTYMSILWLLTRPKYRRKGVATALMKHVISKAKELGCEKIFIEPEDVRSLNLYCKLGFRRLYDLLKVDIQSIPKLKPEVNAEVTVRNWDDTPPSDFREVIGLYYTPKYEWIALKRMKELSKIFQNSLWEAYAYNVIIDDKNCGIFTDSRLIKIWVNKINVNNTHLISELLKLSVLKGRERKRKILWTWLKEDQYNELTRIGFGLKLTSKSQLMCLAL